MILGLKEWKKRYWKGDYSYCPIKKSYAILWYFLFFKIYIHILSVIFQDKCHKRCCFGTFYDICWYLITTPLMQKVPFWQFLRHLIENHAHKKCQNNILYAPKDDGVKDHQSREYHMYQWCIYIHEVLFKLILYL